MCVIIVKEKDIKMPSVKILEQAALRNPHGFGFCTENKIFKTLNFKDFLKELETVKNSEPCIIHFRFATVGSVKIENCHPFNKNNINFAHNGTIYNVYPKNDKTDSETFFNDNLIPLINKHDFNSSVLNQYIYKFTFGSKFALMKNGKIKLFGNFENIDGLKYSNTYFFNDYRYL